jgi:hypothetical protein
VRLSGGPSAHTRPSAPCASGRVSGHKGDVDRNPLPVSLADPEAYRQAGKSAYGRGSSNEAVALHVESLAFLGADEAVVFGLVEPEHLSVHGFAARLDAESMGIGFQRRSWHIGHRGISPFRLIP